MKDEELLKRIADLHLMQNKILDEVHGACWARWIAIGLMICLLIQGFGGCR